MSKETFQDSREQLIADSDSCQPSNYHSIGRDPTTPSTDIHLFDVSNSDDKSRHIHRRYFSLAEFLYILGEDCRHRDFVKFCIALLYLTCVSFLLSCLMVVAHLRMPNNSTWGGQMKPLPDLVLDSITRSPWAFQVAEILIKIISSAAILLAIFHRHTFVVLRRGCCILGNVFLLRAVSVVVTSLPPSYWPATLDECRPIQISSASEFLSKVWRIFAGMGLKIQGGATCGDFVFSGHTSTLTLFNLLFVTYAPCNIIFLLAKVLTTFFNIAGAIAILLSREHYTVDVLLALAISYYAFAEYHFVARYIQLTKSLPHCDDDNNNTSTRAENRTTNVGGFKSLLLAPLPLFRYCRIKLMAPLAYFMERHGDGLIENKLRIPCLKHCSRRSS